MKVDISQFHQTFFEEAAEHLAGMEKILVTLDLSAPDQEDLNAIFRAAHSIKGGSGVFGFSEMSEVTHTLESLLDAVRSGQKLLEPSLIDACLEACDVLAVLLDCYRGGTAVDSNDQQACTDIRAKLQQLCDSGPEAPAADAGFGFFDEPIAAAVSAADDGFGFFDEPPATAAAAAEPAAPESAPSTTASRDNSARNAGNTENSSIRVSIEKTDQLINLVGELVITEAMLEQFSRGGDGAQSELFHQALAQLSRNTRQLQEAAMSLRMLPIGQIFSRFPRLVRDLAGKLGKQIELTIEGETTELDKGLIQRLADPLTHIVRNSVDHGVETPERRSATGKPARGSITLRAFHQGGNIVIEVIDDGRGLDRERILAKARERGLPAHPDMSDAEVWQLIFEPGFSTAEAVTDVSGRGVGMDVVRRNISAMSGRVDIESWAGRGSRITIRLPLTLAILDGMLVNVADQTYVIPLAGIVESLQPSADSISSVAGSGRVVRVRGDYIPLTALHDLFNLESRCSDPSDGIVVLLEAAGKKFALQVDALAGQSQVVIKSLESNYRRVAGFSGATILGDGHVAMILDVDGLLRMSQQAR